MTELRQPRAVVNQPQAPTGLGLCCAPRVGELKEAKSKHFGMADYGRQPKENKEAKEKIEDKQQSDSATGKRLNEKPLGFIIAALAGLAGGAPGLFLSPISLLVWNRFTPYEQKKKDGSSITVNAWTAWAATGLFVTPLLWVLNSTNQVPAPDQSSKQQLTTDPDTVAAALVVARLKEDPFTPGVEGRSPSEVCNSTTEDCQTWTALMVGCEENMKRRDAGYMGQFRRNYCSEAEEVREKVTGILSSTDPGAYKF